MEKDLKENKDWFVVCSKPKQETIIKENLNRMGVETYLPFYMREKKKNKQKIKVPSPLFSGYLFARFSIQEMYHKIRYTRGVKSVLGNHQYLFTISSDKITLIKEKERNGFVELQKKTIHFQKGDKVLIDEGTFDGWEGIFHEELPDKQRAIILLTNVSYSNKLIVPKKILRHN